MIQLVDRPSVIDRPPVVDDPLAPDGLLEIVRALARDAGTWRALARHDDSHRWYVRLSVNPRYDAWLIGWYPHQGVDLHDHGGSAGALYVVEGELLETQDGSVPSAGFSKSASRPAPPSRSAAATSTRS
jgi:hypothetical protein